MLGFLPIVVNAVFTPMIIGALVGFREFVKNPVYHIFLYGPYLWSIYGVIFAYLAFMFFKSEEENIRRILGGVRDKPLLSITIATGLVVLCMSLSYGLSLVFGRGYDTSILKALPLHVLLYLATVGSIIAGVCEEFTWRGYLLTRLEKLTGKTIIAVVIQAALFGFYHGFTMHALSTMIFGLITGFIYAKSRRLIPLMIGHWLNNAIGFSIAYFT